MYGFEIIIVKTDEKLGFKEFREKKDESYTIKIDEYTPTSFGFLFLI